MIKQISIMSLATVMLFGWATATKVNQAEINKHPITKVCIQDNRHTSYKLYKRGCRQLRYPDWSI